MNRIIIFLFSLCLCDVMNANSMMVVEDAGGRNARPFRIKSQVDLGFNQPAISYSHVLYLITESEASADEKMPGKGQIIESEFLDQLKDGKLYLVKLDVRGDSILMHMQFDCSVKLSDKTLKVSKDFERFIPIGRNASGVFSGLSFSVDWLKLNEEAKP